jgi:TctA family transporter
LTFIGVLSPVMSGFMPGIHVLTHASAAGH